MSEYHLLGNIFAFFNLPLSLECARGGLVVGLFISVIKTHTDRALSPQGTERKRCPLLLGLVIARENQ